jgi:hypothetical protein
MKLNYRFLKDALEVKRWLLFIRMIDQSLKQQLENGQEDMRCEIF